MRKLILILSAVFVFVLSAAAQDRTISGKVTNDKGAPLEGVSVTSPDGKYGTQTDKEGKYSLVVPSGVKGINFSYVNFEGQNKTIGKQLSINASMRPLDSKMEEVVVIGYGTQKRKDVTASISSIKGQAVTEKTVQSFEQALAGRAAGVQVSIPSGVLNSPPVFRVRGTNSISNSSYPLIVVDGVPSPTGDFSSTNSAANALASINPNDIESIDIAKDAAAAAIYGSRAANGVVFITTRKGRPGKARVSFNSSYGFTSLYGVPKVLNAQQYMDYKNMAAANNQNVNSTNPIGAGYTKFLPSLDAKGNMIDTRWADYVYRQGFNTDQNLNISGGNDNTTYYFSAGYTKQEGILRNNDFARKNILMNIDSRVSKIFSVGGKISYSNELNSAATSSGSLSGEAFNTGGLGRTVVVNAPNVAPYRADGSYNIDNVNLGLNVVGRMNNTVTVGFYNPVIVFDKNRSNSETNHIQSNIYAQLKPFKWLTLKSLYGIDYLLVDNEIFQTPFHGDGFAATGQAFSTLGKYKRWTWDNTAQFDYTWRKHTFGALVGQEQDRRTSDGFGLGRTGITDLAYDVIQAGWLIDVNSGNTLGENFLSSVFGRLNYDFAKKYSVSGNIRQDQYSALPGQKETFWGVSGAWDLNREKFWSRVSKTNVFSSMKLHSSYGKVGNIGGIGDFASYSTFGSGNYGGTSTLFFNQAGNPKLKWETSNKFDLGANFGLFKERLNIEMTYYKNDVSNLILNVPQAPSTGLPIPPTATLATVPANVGSMYNKGLELTVTAIPIRCKDFSWTSSFNYTTNENMVTALAPGLTQVLQATSGLETVNRTAVGYSVGSLWLVHTGGVDPKTGSRILYNATGNKVLYRFAPTAGLFNFSYEDGTRYNNQDGTARLITQAADAVMYNAVPKIYGGWSNNFRFKNFDLDVLFTYQAGFYVYYGTHAGLFDQRFWNNSVEVLNAWKKQGDITNVPRPVFGDNVSNGSALPMDFNLFKGDFVKLKNVSLGYTLPSEVTNKIKISSARFFVSASNLAIFTNYPGPDPEVSSNGNTSNSQGVDRNTIVNGRTITAGFNIGF